MQLVLASTSPYRRELLARLRLAFATARPDVDEAPLPGEPAWALVRRLAEAKARAVAAQHPNALIIGSDQAAELDGKTLGKPADHDAAIAQLSRASGRCLTFFTGLCVYNAKTQSCRVEVIPYGVLFRTLSRPEIERYLELEQPYDCAGSFKSEGLGSALFEKHLGDDPTALIGLPLIRLVQLLAAEGVHVLGASPRVC